MKSHHHHHYLYFVRFYLPNVSINAPNLSKELQDYSLTIAKKYGLKGEIEISVQKSNKVGGFVNTDFIEGKGIDTKIYMNPNKIYKNMINLFEKKEPI